MSKFENLNLAVLVGEVARPVNTKVLASGVSIVNVDVKVKAEGVPTHTVPVSWLDPPSWALELEVGQSVVVIGRVRQQWFGQGGKFVDVLAESILKAPSKAGLRRALGDAAGQLNDIAS